MQLTLRQVAALSSDRVRRHGVDLSRDVDARLNAADGPPTDTTPAGRLARLAAVRASRAASLHRAAGAAARWLQVDADHAARLWERALRSGAPWREAQAAAHLDAAAALGAAWFADERLRPPPADLPLADPLRSLHFVLPDVDAEAAGRWVAAHWSSPFRDAARRAEAFMPGACYALRRALDDDFAKDSVRAIAAAVFTKDQATALQRHALAERAMVASLPQTTPRLESACLAGGLVFGVGRCVRLIQQHLPPAGGPRQTVDDQVAHLKEALNELVADAHH